MSVLTLGGWSLAVCFALAGLALLDLRRRSLNRAIHELRRPLQQTLLALPTKGEGSAPAERAIRRSLTALDDLDASVNRLTAPSRRVEVDLEDLIEDCVEMGLVEGGSVELRWGTSPTKVLASPDRLRQVFDNLIRNAIQHGRRPVEVTATGNERFIRVSVRNRMELPGEALRAPRRRGRQGQGLRVARSLTAELGGRLISRQRDDRWEAVVELPKLPAGHMR